jgi:VCBS repeat-containing protein
MANTPPDITSNGGGTSANIDVPENSNFVTTVTATDPDAGDKVTFSVSGPDAALFTINPDTGFLAFTDNANFENPLDAGKNNVYDITVTAKDTAGATDTQDLVITVTNTNDGPNITSNGGGEAVTIPVAEGMTAVTNVVATDEDAADIVMYTISGDDAARFTIGLTSGILTFLTAPDFEAPMDKDGNNRYEINVKASDGIDFDTQAITVMVTDLNDSAPIITSNGGGATAKVNVAENTKAVTTVTATDPDAGSTLEYGISGGSDAARFAIDKTTGVLTFVAAPNFEGPTDSNLDNKYEVTVMAFDGVNSDTQAITVTVTDANESPPVITSDGGASTAALNILENTTAVTIVTATDADPSDTVTFSISGGVDAARFSIDTLTGALAFKVAPNFELPNDADAKNTYEVTVKASDGVFFDTQAITVTIVDVDEVPVFTSDGGTPTTIFRFESVLTVTKAVAVDPEGKTPISYGIAGGADAALFLIESGTGILSFLSAPDFENPSDANQDNFYELMLSATEGTTTGFQMLTVRIDNVNEAPTFTVGGTQTANEDSGSQSVTGFVTNITTGPSGKFADLGTKVTFNVTNTNNALFMVQPAIDPSGNLTYSLNPNVSGSAKVTVVAMDNGGTDDGGVDTAAAQFFNIVINPVNDAPDFSLAGNQIVNEDAGAQSVTAFLTSISTGPADESIQSVTVTVTNDNNSLFLAQPTINGAGTLTFTTVANASGFATVTVKLQDNGGTANGGVDTTSKTFTITVNPVNDVPSFVIGANQTANEDAGTKTVMNFATAISAGPADESGQIVSFLVSNDNTALFSGQPVIDGLGNLTYTLAADAFGSAKVSVQAKDTGGTMFGGVDTSAAQFFTITVNAVNDAPTYALAGDPTVNEDAGAQMLAGFLSAQSVGPANESAQTATITVTNTNNALFSGQPAIDGSGNLTFTPADNVSGMATVTVKVQDTGGTAFGGMDTTTTTFLITVNPVNDAPSFAVQAEAKTTINTGLNTFPMFATAISAGPADESGQTVSFVLSNDNIGLFSEQPAIDSSGTLTFRTASDATGLAMVTVFAMDDGGTAFGGIDTSATLSFLIRILDKNVAPSFTIGADQTVNEDSGAADAPAFLTMISPGPSIESLQKVSFLVTNDNNALFSLQPTIDATGRLNYTPASNAFGSAVVSVIAMDDGGTANGGDDTSDPQTFTITVNAVNDVPSFTIGGKQTLNEDAGTKSVAKFAAKISTGPANESGQSVTFLVTTDNPNLFAVDPAIDANGTLTYTTAADAFGTATVTVFVQDNGGIDFGGVDTSAAQTFTIVVNPVNDPPTFIVGGDLTVAEDAGPQFFPILSNLSAGPANEAGQSASISTSSTNLSLFAVAPSIDASGNLTYTPATNANGTATVTVTATDTGGTANGGVDARSQTFTITVSAVNDDPSFNLQSKLAVAEDAGAQSLTGFAFGISAGPVDEAAQPLTFTVAPIVTSGDLAFSQAPTIDATGTLTFDTAADTFGTATITVTLDDGNGGTATQTFSLTVNAVNDPPTSVVVVPNPPLSGIGPQIIPGVLALGTGANNEPDTLVVSVSVASTTGNIAFTTMPSIDPAGTLTYEARRNSIGTATLAITVSDGTNATSTQFVTLSVDTTGPVETIGYPEFAVGSDLGLTYVSFHNADRSERFFSPAFPGTEFGARVAGADFTRDGIADLVIGSGVGRTTLVQVIDAVTQTALFSIQPFESSFTGGVYVAAGDINGDGIADLVITPDEGGGPRVRVFDGATFQLVADFFGIDDPNFRGGARAALGDLTGDARADLVVAAGFGGGPRVAAFDGTTLLGGTPLKLFNDFFAFEQTLRNGVFVAVGDLDGDGRAEIFAGGGPDGGPRVTAFNGATLIASGGATLTPLSNFFAGDPDNRGGIRIAVKDLDGDFRADLVVGSGTGAGSRVTAYLAPSLGAPEPEAAFAFDAFEGFVGGVFVG